MLDLALANIALISLGFNFYLYKALKSRSQSRPESLELREFLADLMGGRALLKVERVDSSNLFMKDPSR